jgi:hypothetical protein
LAKHCRARYAGGHGAKKSLLKTRRNSLRDKKSAFEGGAPLGVPCTSQALAGALVQACNNAESPV